MKPRISLSSTKATSTGGVPIYYGDGYYYGDEGLYYGTWYAADGDLTQGEKPIANVRAENIVGNTKQEDIIINVKEQDVRINVGVDKPSIEVLE